MFVKQNISGAIAGFLATYILSLDQDILSFLQVNVKLEKTFNFFFFFNRKVASSLELNMVSFERCEAFIR